MPEYKIIDVDPCQQKVRLEIGKDRYGRSEASAWIPYIIVGPRPARRALRRRKFTMVLRFLKGFGMALVLIAVFFLMLAFCAVVYHAGRWIGLSDGEASLFMIGVVSFVAATAAGIQHAMENGGPGSAP